MSKPERRGMVVFEERGDGRIDVMLGVVAVGAIMALDHPEYRAAWWLMLPPCASGLRVAENTERAKAAAAKAVRDWLQAAGLRGAR